MPNYCSNIIFLSHEDKSKMYELRKVLEDDDTALLNFLKPLPVGEKREDLDSKWFYNYWGTKWDVEVDYVEEREAKDFEIVMKEWCEENNHDYNDYDDIRELGVYNNNISSFPDNFNSFEAFAEWFNENVETVDDGQFTLKFWSASRPPIKAYDFAVENGWNIRSIFIESGDELYGVYENGQCILYKLDDDDIPDDLRSTMIDYGLIKEEGEEESEEDSE
jgi:hypothetical protein